MYRNRYYTIEKVAPRVGAWIETNVGLFADAALKSHPVWVRGLKLERKAANF